jgi:uncharacterized ParB-like nuclease family protein
LAVGGAATTDPEIVPTEWSEICSPVLQFFVSAAHKNDPKQVEAMMNTLLHKVEHCNTTTDCPKVGRISPISFGGFWWVDEDGKVSL